jgi:hypothetical protein
MDESIAVDGNPDVQFLARQMHEYEVAGDPARSCSCAVRGN